MARQQEGANLCQRAVHDEMRVVSREHLRLALTTHRSLTNQLACAEKLESPTNAPYCALDCA